MDDVRSDLARIRTSTRFGEPAGATLKKKLVYLVIAVICIMVGIIGLVIPIIPGLLFLLLAVYLLGRVSRRVKRWSDTQPQLQALHARFDRLDGVSLGTRIKVGALMSLEVLVSSVGAAVSAVRRLIPSPTR